MPGLPVLHYLPEFAKVHVHIGDAIQPLSFSVTCFSCPQSFPASGSFLMCWLFTWGGQIIGASASVLPMSIRGGFLRMGCFDLPAVQGTLKSLLQLHSSKASVLHCSVFFMVRLSHPYMTTGKTIALTIWTFVSKMFLLSNVFNTLPRFVIAFFQGASVF